VIASGNDNPELPGNQSETEAPYAPQHSPRAHERPNPTPRSAFEARNSSFSFTPLCYDLGGLAFFLLFATTFPFAMAGPVARPSLMFCWSLAIPFLLLPIATPLCANRLAMIPFFSSDAGLIMLPAYDSILDYFLFSLSVIPCCYMLF